MGSQVPPTRPETRSAIGPGAVIVVALLVVAVVGFALLARPGAEPDGAGSATATASASAGSATPTASASPRAGSASAAVPTVSPPASPAHADGAIAFDHGSDVWIMQADGSDPRPLVTGAYGIGWSPDGTRLLVVLQDPATAAEVVAVVDAAGGEPRVLGPGSHGAWSPDGQTVAVSDPYAGQEITLVNVADGRAGTTIQGSLPDWSPDGSLVAFVRAAPPEEPCGDEFCPPSPCGLWLLDVASVAEERLTPDELFCEYLGPDWSPTGDTIAIGNRVLELDGSERFRLDEGEFLADRPWSPDGRMLAALVADATLNHRTLEVISVESGERRIVVPEGEAILLQPSWAPSGAFLAYSAVVYDATGNGTPRIHVVPATGDGEPLAVGPDDAQFPLWQPLPAD